jgi:hypothetical protein
VAANDDQTAFLDYFLDDKLTVDYAVLIDAPWGSGKTYFLRDYLNRKFPKTDGTPPEFLWVSLFGRTNADEVKGALFAAAHPVLSSKWAALGGSVASDALKKFTGFDVGSKAKALMPDIKAKLIVFDDLERSPMGASQRARSHQQLRR